MPRRFWRPARRSLPIHGRMSSLTDPTAQVDVAARWPLDECLVSVDWRKTGRAVLVWIRRNPELPRYAMVHLQLDLAGRGLGKCDVSVDLRRAALWDRIERSPTRTERCNPMLGQRLVQVARARAERTGVPDPVSWPSAEALLGTVAQTAQRIEVPDFLPVRSQGDVVAQRMARISLSMFAPRRVAEA